MTEAESDFILAGGFVLPYLNYPDYLETIDTITSLKLSPL